MKIFIAAMVVISSLVVLGSAKLTPEDLDSLTGAQWTGTLTYLDYSSKKKVSIPCNLTVTKSVEDKHTWIFDYVYPKEPQANGKKLMLVSKDGGAINDEKVTERTNASDGSIGITTEKQGEDNNRKALFRYTYLISSKTFSIKKEVRYANESEWFERNEYSWQR